MSQTTTNPFKCLHLQLFLCDPQPTIVPRGLRSSGQQVSNKIPAKSLQNILCVGPFPWKQLCMSLLVILAATGLQRSSSSLRAQCSNHPAKTVCPRHATRKAPQGRHECITSRAGSPRTPVLQIWLCREKKKHMGGR